MTFSSPQWLVLLALVPLLVVFYAARVRRRARARPLAEPHLVAGLVPRSPGWRQHVPAAALGVAATAGVLAVAGPTAAVADRRDAARIVVALDTSLSMDQTDVAPDRLTAAREAADAFIGDLPDHVEVGVVEFAGTASVLVPPTADHDAARAVLQGLRPRPATAIGEAVHSSLAALAAARPGPSGTADGTGDGTAGGTAPGAADGESGAGQDGAGPGGAGGEGGEAARTAPRRIVLLSDGGNTAGRPVEAAAQAAAQAGVPVDTIAFGATDPAVPTPRGGVDRETLQALADTTGGRAYEATSGDELRQAYAQIGTESLSDTVRRPVADWWLGGALLAALGGAAAALTWFRRLPL